MIVKKGRTAEKEFTLGKERTAQVFYWFSKRPPDIIGKQALQQTPKSSTCSM